MSDTRKRAEILAPFNDIGTGERFEVGGDNPLIDAGSFSNYEAAGLVRSPSADSAAPAKAAGK